MSDQKVEPVPVTIDDVQSSAPSISPPSDSDDEETPTDNIIITIRKTTMDAVVNQNQTVIEELERKVEKARARVDRFEQQSSPFLPQHPICLIPPPNPASIPTPTSTVQKQIHPHSTVASALTKTSAMPTPVSQPLPPHNPVMAAAMAAAGHPPVSAPLTAPYPFLYPPDHPAMAALMRGVIPTPVPPPHPQPRPQHLAQPSHRTNSSDGNERRPRYWTDDEHQRFLHAVNACGPKNYGQISEYVGTRNPRQVRTHAQKYQKKLEREEAKRREQAMSGSSVGAAAVAVVAAAARAAINGNVPGALPSNTNLPNISMATGPVAPTSSSSGKNFVCSDDHKHQRRKATSIDGSSSTNDMPGDAHGENDVNCQGGDAMITSAAAAAKVAVAAEAANLVGGVLNDRADPIMVSISGCNNGKVVGGNLKKSADSVSGNIVKVEAKLEAVELDRVVGKEKGKKDQATKHDESHMKAIAKSAKSTTTATRPKDVGKKVASEEVVTIKQKKGKDANLVLGRTIIKKDEVDTESNSVKTVDIGKSDEANEKTGMSTMDREADNVDIGRVDDRGSMLEKPEQSDSKVANGGIRDEKIKNEKIVSKRSQDGIVTDSGTNGNHQRVMSKVIVKVGADSEKKGLHIANQSKNEKLGGNEVQVNTQENGLVDVEGGGGKDMSGIVNDFEPRKNATIAKVKRTAEKSEGSENNGGVKVDIAKVREEMKEIEVMEKEDEALPEDKMQDVECNRGQDEVTESTKMDEGGGKSGMVVVEAKIVGSGLGKRMSERELVSPAAKRGRVVEGK